MEIEWNVFWGVIGTFTVIMTFLFSVLWNSINNKDADNKKCLKDQDDQIKDIETRVITLEKNYNNTEVLIARLEVTLKNIEKQQETMSKDIKELLKK